MHHEKISFLVLLMYINKINISYEGQENFESTKKKVRMSIITK